jgi:hypothetical protein
VQADSAAGHSQLARPQQQRAALRGGPLRKADGRFMSREEVCARRCVADCMRGGIWNSGMTSHHMTALPSSKWSSWCRRLGTGRASLPDWSLTSRTAAHLRVMRRPLERPAALKIQMLTRPQTAPMRTWTQSYQPEQQGPIRQQSRQSSLRACMKSVGRLETGGRLSRRDSCLQGHHRHMLPAAAQQLYSQLQPAARMTTMAVVCTHSQRPQSSRQQSIPCVQQARLLLPLPTASALSCPSARPSWQQPLLRLRRMASRWDSWWPTCGARVGAAEHTAQLDCFCMDWAKPFSGTGSHEELVWPFASSNSMHDPS